jgi:hypothetical protein
MRSSAIVRHVALNDLPDEFNALGEAAVAAIRRAYDINAERHDPLIGDDAVVFGIGIYRNSWYLLEQEVETLDQWSSSRPAGSLLITGAGLRLHVYRHGANAEVDLESFRLDDARASATQRMIAQSNTLQLSFPGLEVATETPVPVDSELSELVIIHAGNPDDSCCGIWIGAPIAAEEITRSPWVWIEPLWLAEPGGVAESVPERELSGSPRHDELPEPIITLEPVVAAVTETP